MTYYVEVWGNTYKTKNKTKQKSCITEDTFGAAFFSPLQDTHSQTHSRTGLI